MSTRSLKVELTGDVFRKRTKAKIRLCGKWLERAGFRPGSRVTVTLTTHGQLVLTSEDLQPAVLPSELEAERQATMARLESAAA